MDNSTPTAPLSNRRLFTLAILAYSSFWGVGLPLLALTFGSGSAIGLAIIVALPLIIALRMRNRCDAVRKGELAMLLTLVIVVFVAAVTVITIWYDAGLDHRHTRDLKHAQFGRLLHKDPAFGKVEVYNCKGAAWLQGTVDSHADLQRLNALADQYGVGWSDNVEIATKANETPEN